MRASSAAGAAASAPGPAPASPPPGWNGRTSRAPLPTAARGRRYTLEDAAIRADLLQAQHVKQLRQPGALAGLGVS